MIAYIPIIITTSLYMCILLRKLFNFLIYLFENVYDPWIREAVFISSVCVVFKKLSFFHRSV